MDSFLNIRFTDEIFLLRPFAFHDIDWHGADDAEESTK